MLFCHLNGCSEGQAEGKSGFTISEILDINPFVPNAPFIYPLKTENLKVFQCFQELEKGCFRSKWVNFKNRNY